MSVNTAHANNGVLIHAGEYILLHSDGVTMDFSGQDNPIFKGSKQGRIYLTSHRVIFNNKKPADGMQSFSAPFIAMNDVELEQPVFGANYIKGKVRAQPNGNYIGEVKFKLHFKAGGAIEYGQALMRAARTAQSNFHNGHGYSDDPPPYTPSGAWHEAPPPAYQPPPGYYGWLPAHDAFTGPPPNTVFMSDNPPPYPGIGGPPPYAGPPSQQPGGNYQPAGNFTPATTYQPQQPQQPQGNSDQPNWMGFSLPPSNDQPQQPPAHSWANPNAGNQQPPPYNYGAPGYGAPGYGTPGYGAPGYGAPGYGAPQGGFQGYPTGPQAGGAAAAGAMGFNAPPANSKEAEAMASAFNNPYNQRSGGGNQNPSDMPPAYTDLPPNYDSTRKNQ